MNGQYAYTPEIWPSVSTVLLLLILSIYSWRRRSVPGALPFAIGCLFAVPLTVSQIMIYLAVDAKAVLFWDRFDDIWWLPGTSAITCFILEYAWPGRWLTRRNLILLSIVPLLSILLIPISDFYPEILPDPILRGTGANAFGPVGGVLFLYSFILFFINLVVFAWLFVRSPQYRWPVTLMAAGQITTRLLLFGKSPEREARLLYIPVFIFPYLGYSIALFGFRMFDPIPIARQMTLEQLHAGMLVLDPQGRITSMNPSAEGILGVPMKQAKGKPAREMLSAYPEGQEAIPDETEIEFSMGTDQDLRYYTMTISILRDFRGLSVGRLLLLRDATRQMRDQAQILEQQRVLATIRERERLARELHDSLGQTLAAAHLQASTARLLLAQAKTTETDECLEQMMAMTIAAEADVREYLLGAKTAFSPDLPFLSALRKYVERFSQHYGLHVELSLPPELEARGPGSVVEVQLLRIIQEALSNVRKHARAKKAEVIFAVSDSRMQVAINDDGQGFDPAAVGIRQAEGFGLQAMRERAEALGGMLDVISQPGQGTRVTLQVPLQRELAQ